jgi:hypothetical protein
VAKGSDDQNRSEAKPRDWKREKEERGEERREKRGGEEQLEQMYSAVADKWGTE